MADLQHVHRPHLPAQPLLNRQPRIAGEERPEAAVLHQQDRGVFVQVLAPAGPTGVRMEHPESNPVEFPVGPGPGRPPTGSLRRQLVKKAPVERVRRGPARLRCRSDLDFVQDRANPAEMIRMRVGDDQQADLSDPAPAKKRYHHVFPGIPTGVGRTGIHQYPASARGADDGPIPLPDRQKK